MPDLPWWWEVISYLSEPGDEWATVFLILLVAIGIGSALLVLAVIWFRNESIEELKEGLDKEEDKHIAPPRDHLESAPRSSH